MSLPDLQHSLTEQFGLALPLNPLRQILQRAAREGYVRREAGVFYRDEARCAGSTFSQISDRVSRTEGRVTEVLQAFAKEQHSIDWTPEQTEDALLAFIGDSGLDVLFATAEQSVLPRPMAERGQAFVVGSFLARAQNESPALFKDCETIIKGALLANALYVPDHGRIGQRFRKTRIYLDTSFLLYFLGYAGVDRQAPCAELIGLLSEYGAELCCYSHTIDEIRGVLDACAARIRRHELRDAVGPTIEYFVTQGLTSTDVDLLSARVPSRLAVHGIRIISVEPVVQRRSR